MYVYFVELLNRDGYLKIGKSNYPKDRRMALQICCPYQLVIKKVVEFQNEKQAYAVEKKLHKIFKERNIRGEWFHPDIYEDALALCEKYAAKNYRWEHEICPRDLDNEHLESMRGIHF